MNHLNNLKLIGQKLSKTTPHEIVIAERWESDKNGMPKLVERIVLNTADLIGLTEHDE